MRCALVLPTPSGPTWPTYPLHHLRSLHTCPCLPRIRHDTVGTVGHSLVSAGVTSLAVLLVTYQAQSTEKQPFPSAHPQHANGFGSVQVGSEMKLRLFKKLKPTRLAINQEATVTAENRTRKMGRGFTIRALPKGLFIDGERVSTSAAVTASSTGLLVKVDDGLERIVPSKLKIRLTNGKLHIVAHVPLEDYIAGVVNAEMPHGAPEAQKAQAIVARTYALDQQGRHGTYDFCDLTHCQAYRGMAPASVTAVSKSTAGTILATQDGCLAAVFYSSTCGGHTTSAHSAWGSTTAPHLQAISDLKPSGEAWCSDSSHSEWQFEIPRAKLGHHLRRALGPSVEIPLAIRLEYTEGGWVSNVWIAGLPRPLPGERFHNQMGRIFGWNRLKSAHFTLHQDPQTLYFQGRGLGHGVGLCQHGAMSMARTGLHAKQILQHYFPSLLLTRNPTPHACF